MVTFFPPYLSIAHYLYPTSSARKRVGEQREHAVGTDQFDAQRSRVASPASSCAQTSGFNGKSTLLELNISSNIIPDLTAEGIAERFLIDVLLSTSDIRH